MPARPRRAPRRACPSRTELLLAAGSIDAAEAVRTLIAAGELAARQGALMLAARIETTLAPLLVASGRPQDVGTRAAAILARCDESADAPEIARLRALRARVTSAEKRPATIEDLPRTFGRSSAALPMFSFLISDAHAQAAGAAAAPGFSIEQMLLPALMIVAFYFLLIRPQQKRAKEAKAMMEGIKSGDEVITSGGLLGRVTRVAEQYVTLEVGNVVGAASAVEMTIQKSAVSALLPKGTIRAI